MSSLANPRGPLPPRVYWVRRGCALAVLVLALLLVVGLVKLVFGSSDDQSGAAGGTAQQAAGEPTATGTPKTRATPRATATPAVEPSQPALAEPTGRCTPSDIAISPRVNDAVAGTSVPIILTVHTRKAAACVWRFAPRNVMLKVTRDNAAIWSSTACKQWIPQQTLVLRSESVTEVEVTWNGRRSDTGCEAQYSDYATDGTYQVLATALGGEADTTEFGLRRPTEADVAPSSAPSTAPTSTPSTPATTPSGQSSGKPTSKPSGKPSTPTSQSVDPSAEPSGAVEPD